MTTAAVILAAGASTRLGQPKQLLEIGGTTLLERAVAVAFLAGCEPVVVVLGASAADIAERCDLRRAWVVVNAGWAAGMSSSVRAGVELVQGFAEVSGLVLMTCDMPGVTAAHLAALIGDGVAVRGSRYAGRTGVPAYLPRASFLSLLQLDGDTGARELLHEADSVELVSGEMDVDTPADAERARRELGELQPTPPTHLPKTR